MLPYGELEYSGFRQRIGDLAARFAFRNGHEAEVPEKAVNAEDQGLSPESIQNAGQGRNHPWPEVSSE